MALLICFKHLCVVCEKHLATQTVAESALDAVHGFTTRLCLCCHVAAVEKHLEEVKQGLSTWKEKLEKEPCSAP